MQFVVSHSKLDFLVMKDSNQGFWTDFRQIDDLLLKAEMESEDLTEWLWYLCAVGKIIPATHSLKVMHAHNMQGSSVFLKN
jgi:hypothetical protein